MNKTIQALLLVALLPMAGAATADNEAQVERLTREVAKMLPMGAIFEMLAKDDPAWPMQHDPKAVSAGQLACLRSELSPEGELRRVRGMVAEYVDDNPGRVEKDLEVLEGGASEAMSRMVMAGAEEERTGVAANPDAVLAGLSPDQVGNFLSFFTEDSYAPLRELAGFGDALSVDKTAEENEAAGEAVGSGLALKVMLRAMGTCNVPASALN